MGFLVAETLALFLPFIALRSELLLIADLTFLFLFWGYLGSRSEFGRYGAEIRFFTTHAVTAKLTTTMLLLGIFFFVAMRGSGGTFFMSKENFAVLFRGSAAFFTDFYPQVSVNGSFQEFAASVAPEQLSAMPTFQALMPAAQVAATEQAVAALTANFSRSLGVEITPSSTTSGVIYDFHCLVSRALARSFRRMVRGGVGFGPVSHPAQPWCRVYHDCPVLRDDSL